MQCGNGGTSMSRGTHSSQKKGGGNAVTRGGTKSNVINANFGQARSTNNDLFDRKLKKGDIMGAIDQSLLSADAAKAIAKDAIKSLDAGLKRLDKLANEVTKKYPKL